MIIMKKIFFLILSALFIGFGCDDDKIEVSSLTWLTVDKIKLNAKTAGDQLSLTVTCNDKDWTVTSNKEWVVTEIIKSEVGGEIKITVAENGETMAIRTAELTFTANNGEIVKTTTIQQLGTEPEILLSADVMAFDSQEQEFSFTITTNYPEFNFSADENWITKVETANPSATFPQTTQHITCKITRNQDGNNREGVITIIGKGPGVENTIKTLTIMQLNSIAWPKISVDGNTITDTTIELLWNNNKAIGMMTFKVEKRLTGEEVAVIDSACTTKRVIITGLESNTSYRVTVTGKYSGQDQQINSDTTFTISTPLNAKLVEASGYAFSNRSSWKILSYSTQENGGEGATNGYLPAMIDNNAGTFWHSKWSGAPAPTLPIELIFDLGSSQSLTAVAMQNRNANNNTDEYVISFSNDIPSSYPTGNDLKTTTYLHPDKDKWSFVNSIKVKNLRGDNTKVNKLEFPSPITARIVKLKITATASGATCSVAEFEVK